MSKHPQSLFGSRLRAARIRAGLAQDRLGVLIGLDESCSSARISRYETGKHAPPFEIAQSLAVALDVPVAYFYCPQDELAKVLVALYNLTEHDLRIVLDSINNICENSIASTVTRSIP